MSKPFTLQRFSLTSCLSALALFASVAHAAPTLDPLFGMQETDFPAGCSCRFFTQDDAGRQKLLLSWVQTGKRAAYIRDRNGPQLLYLRNEKYLPQKREVPRSGDHLTALFSNPEWRIQVLGKATRICTPKMKCEGVDYKARLLLQRNNIVLDNVDLYGHCDPCLFANEF